jgi:hypothetical protein
MYTQFFGAFDHNRAKTAEGRAEQDARGKAAIADALIFWGLNKTLGILGTTFKNEVLPFEERFKGFNTRGLDVWEGEEATRYLKSSGGKATYMATEDGQGLITLGENPTRQEIVEELIHHEQNIKYGKDYMVENRNLIEIRAQDRLLKIGKKEGWSKDAMDEIKQARETWVQKYEKEGH